MPKPKKRLQSDPLAEKLGGISHLVPSRPNVQEKVAERVEEKIPVKRVSVDSDPLIPRTFKLRRSRVKQLKVTAARDEMKMQDLLETILELGFSAYEAVKE